MTRCASHPRHEWRGFTARLGKSASIRCIIPRILCLLQARRVEINHSCSERLGGISCHCICYPSIRWGGDGGCRGLCRCRQGARLAGSGPLGLGASLESAAASNDYPYLVGLVVGMGRCLVLAVAAARAISFCHRILCRRALAYTGRRHDPDGGSGAQSFRQATPPAFACGRHRRRVWCGVNGDRGRPLATTDVKRDAFNRRTNCRR